MHRPQSPKEVIVYRPLLRTALSEADAGTDAGSTHDGMLQGRYETAPRCAGGNHRRYWKRYLLDVTHVHIASEQFKQEANTPKKDIMIGSCEVIWQDGPFFPRPLIVYENMSSFALTVNSLRLDNLVDKSISSTKGLSTHPGHVQANTWWVNLWVKSTSLAWWI